MTLLSMIALFIFLLANSQALISPRVGAFSGTQPFLDHVIDPTAVPSLLQQSTIITITPNLSTSTTPTYLFFPSAMQEVSSDGAPLSDIFPVVATPLTQTPTTLNTSIGTLTGDSLVGSPPGWLINTQLSLDFVYIPEDLTVLFPGNIEIPFSAGIVKHFVRASANFQWSSSTPYCRLLVGLTTVNAPIKKFKQTPRSENRVENAFSAGGITLLYTALKTIWIDGQPEQASFHLYQPGDALPAIVTDYLNATSKTLSQFPNPVYWASWIVKAPQKSLLIDPSYAILLDSTSSSSTKSWLRRHPLIVFAAIAGVVALVLIVAITLVCLLRKKTRTLVVGKKREKESDYHILATH